LVLFWLQEIQKTKKVKIKIRIFFFNKYLNLNIKYK
jgi:hypothetical protein